MSAAVRAVIILVLLTVTAIPLADKGRAQGFFQSLFGFGSTAPPPVRPMLPPSYRAPIVPPARGGNVDDRHDEHSISLSGNYRTMCVRMCDGYYFPVSGSVSRRAFHRDAGICRASCGQEAVLFFHSSSSGDASTMVDLTGRAYAKLPNAFRYRKALVDGCKCKPEPWARSELNRHLAYAVQATTASRLAAPQPVSPPPVEPVELDNSTTVAEVPVEQPAEQDANPDPSASAPSARPPRALRERHPPQRQPTGRPDRRLASSTAAPPLARVTAARPQRPVKASPYGLGGNGLRWPGD